MIEFDCPKCQHHITAPDRDAGAADVCPKCNAPVTIPQIPGARKPCPICGESIAITAKKCRFCGAFLDAPPLGRSPAPALRHDGCAQGDYRPNDYRPRDAMPRRVSNAPDGPELRKGAWDYIREFWSVKFCDFTGRATRREYWCDLTHIVGICFVVCFFIGFMAGAAGKTEDDLEPLFESVGAVVWTIFLIPLTALLCRRCHDVNLPGAIGILMTLLPQALGGAINSDAVIDALALLLAIGLIAIGLLPGVKGANQYGPVSYDNPPNDAPRAPGAAA